MGKPPQRPLSRLAKTKYKTLGKALRLNRSNNSTLNIPNHPIDPTDCFLDMHTTVRGICGMAGILNTIYVDVEGGNAVRQFA